MQKAPIKTIRIVPTYACNLACDYCYASKYIGEYPQMSWQLFSRIVDRLVKAGITQVVFIGGDPTMWEHLDRAIKTLYALGMSVTLLSNAIKRTSGVVPMSITVNGTNLGSDRLRKIILPNLEWYREQGVYISLRFNLRASDSSALLKKYATWGKEYADEVYFAPIVPYAFEKKLGKNLYDFAKMVRAHGQKITLNRAMPFCIFTKPQMDYLREHAGLYTQCQTGCNQMAINPDGSILPCVDINMPSKIDADINLTGEKLRKQGVALRDIPAREECLTCKHYKKDCQGGCLTTRVQ